MCAIFGISGNSEASNITYLGLHALQHRGQEGAGIVSTLGSRNFLFKKLGLVSEVFSSATLAQLPGTSAIGHTRYSTAGGNAAENLQPIVLRTSLGWIGVVHNGNLVNAKPLAKKLEQMGSIFQSSADTEVIVHLMARSGESDLVKALVASLKQLEGAYSLLVMDQQYLIAVRDPYGFRPLVLGNLNGKPVFASETTAFDLIGAKYEREVDPGEMIIVPHDRPAELISQYPFRQYEQKKCVFEHIYFARPDSVVFGAGVYETRKALGKRLAQEQPASGMDMVIPVPDSGVYASIGFSEESGIPFEMGIIRSHYIGRTFIEPSQSIRNFGVKLKLNPLSGFLRDKKIVVVDDSLVRGTTSKKLIQHLRESGAKEVHLRISAPPTMHPCFYGIDTPTSKELLASRSTIEQMKELIGADSLGFLSLQGLLETCGSSAGTGFCHACFSGNYPTDSLN
ncbi:MAG: amidophosphoribosyltransferase [Proteobacteria bacterium]|nr:amidophosphoribosyltransferase [Pseudomonadota bacterium]NDC23778.1 amidophosphoribosyltransferase [Pseudomonadota bacterium]